MGDPIKVMILGAGRMGAGIGRVILGKKGLSLVAVCDTRSDLSGKDLGRLIGRGEDVGICIDADLETAIRRGPPQVAIQACCSTLEAARRDVALLLGAGVNVVSIAEEMAYPACASAHHAHELERLAVANGVSVVGTGVNPGFVLDLLVIALTGVCSHVDSIAARRCNDLAPYGASVLAAQGIGLSPEAFARGVSDGDITGHVGFAQSIHMIASALGWSIDRIEERREPIVARVRRETPYLTVEPGQVAGCLHTALAYRGSRALITLTHPQQVHPGLEGQTTGDRIEICGCPDICLAGSPEIPGGEATMAIAVNMIPRVLNAPPGLHTMGDLPVPSALLDDVRHFVTGSKDSRDG